MEPEPSRRSPVRSATKQHYALNESASSEEDEDMFFAPKSTRTPLASAGDAPVQTPRNSQSASIKSRVASSSALRNSGRGRTASVAPSEGWSAMKPIPMKTVFLSSPPRPGRSSETESSSDSDDEVRLIEDPTTSARKRKAAAGEYTWDERSRSCIPKRERSRSRSMTASAHRERYGESGTSGIADSSPASDRSHLQERIFPTSENDMLKNLLTNRLHARAMLGQSTPAKQEVHDAGHDPFLEEMEGASPILNAEPDPDIMLNLPEMPEPDFSGEHQPIFDFSQSALADEDSDDDFFSRQTGMSSSDDGFERSIIHLDGPQGWQGEAEEQELLPEFDIDDRSTVKDEELDDDVSMATAVDTADKTEIAIEQPVDPMRVSEELREPIIQQDASAPLGTLSAPSGKESQIQSMSEIAGIEQTVENLESNDDIPVPSIRSSSVTSELPPSSPPPLPSYPIGVTTSDFVDDQDGHALKDSPLTPSQAGPLSPKATNRLMPKQDNRYLATPKTAATASPALKHLLSTQKSRRSLKHTVYEVPVSDTPDVPVPRYDEKLFTDRARSPSPSVSGVTEAPLRSPPPGLRQFTPKGLSTYTTDQLFSRAKSPQLPQMTPVRLKSISPAPVALYTMVETHATPPDYQSTTVGSAVDRPKAEVAQAEVQQCVQEAIATLPAQTDVMDGAASPAMSPRPVSTLAFPPLSSITRPATRSPSPLRGPSPVKPPSNFEAQLPATPGPAARLAPYSATARPSSLLVPPSPFLGPISRGSRSPSPNAEAEQATLSLLSRVRALRSPSVPARPTSSHGRRLSPAAVVAVIDQSRIDTIAGASDQKKIQGVADLDEVQGEQNDLEPAEEEEVVPADELATNSDPAPVLGPVADMKEAPNESIRDVAPTPIDSNGPIASSEDISDTGLTDTKSDTDSEAEDAEVEHSLSQPRTPSKSPAAVRKLLPVDDPVMSPNVTVRRDRSASRSTASTRSTRSARTAANRPSSASRKLSFSDIAALDSSPISVAASIGRRSFDALDSSSEDELDEDEDKRASLGRPSPAKEIAAQQLRYEAMEEDELSSSEDEDLNLSSSPTRSNAGSLAKETTPGAMGITTTSTPARLMHSMALDTSEDAHGRHIAVSTPNPKRQSMQDPAPAPSPTQASHAILEQETTPPAQVSITSGTSRDAGMKLLEFTEGSNADCYIVDEIATLQEAKIESSQDSSAPEEDEIASENSRKKLCSYCCRNLTDWRVPVHR